jgi:hypothetical protein
VQESGNNHWRRRRFKVPETENPKEQSAGEKWSMWLVVGILLWIGFVSVAVLVMLSRGH